MEPGWLLQCRVEFLKAKAQAAGFFIHKPNHKLAHTWTRCLKLCQLHKYRSQGLHSTHRFFFIRTLNSIIPTLLACNAMYTPKKLMCLNHKLMTHSLACTAKRHLWTQIIWLWCRTSRWILFFWKSILHFSEAESDVLWRICFLVCSTVWWTDTASMFW